MNVNDRSNHRNNFEYDIPSHFNHLKFSKHSDKESFEVPSQIISHSKNSKKQVIHPINRFSKALKEHELSDEIIQKIFDQAQKIELGMSASILDGENSFYLNCDRERLSLYNLSEIQEIGRGTFGIVYRVQNLVQGIFEVLKMAKVGKNSAENAIQHEIKNLRRLHKILGEKKVKGLQDCPSVFLENGYIGKQYDCDLNTVIKEELFKSEDALNAILQLLSGLSFMHASNLLHGDIKGRNILVDTVAKTCHLADLGGARFIDELDYKSFIHTTIATASTDMDEFVELIEKILQQENKIKNIHPKYVSEIRKDRMRLKKMKEEYVDRRRAHDVFSLGFTFYQLFTKNHYPYFQTEDDYMNTMGQVNSLELESGINRLMGDFVNKVQKNQLIDLILKMLNPNLDLRPTARRAYEMIQNILNSRSNEYRIDCAEISHLPFANIDEKQEDLSDVGGLSSHYFSEELSLQKNLSE
ncbi:MAG: protein kinase [Waddliaceae bacterium]